MPKIIENISSDLFSFLKSRFELGASVDAAGKETTDPAEMHIFTFDFSYGKNKDGGCVVISLLDTYDGTNSLKVYFGEELNGVDRDAYKAWIKFLKELRMFAKVHMFGFVVRNINKPTITKRDIEPMFSGKSIIESATFGPIDGTIKTSRQPLETVQIIIKHTDKIDSKVKNSRSRRIQKIYLSNASGEKFLLPFKSLVAARAMARHVFNEGKPYDEIGTSICQIVEEMLSLNKFYRYFKNQSLTDQQTETINLCRERYLALKKVLSSLISQQGYEKNIGELETYDLSDDESSIFNIDAIPEEIRSAIPYINRLKAHEEVYENIMFKSREEKIKEQRKDFENMKSLLKSIGFECESVDFDGDEYHWVNRYYEVLIDRNRPEYKNTWHMYRNGRKIIGNGVESLKKEFKNHKEFRDYKNLMEADAPSTASVMSPLSMAHVDLEKRFKTNKELSTVKDTSGKKSPLSLLSVGDCRNEVK